MTINRASQPILVLELNMFTLLSNAESSAHSIRTSVSRVRSSKAQTSIHSNENLLATRDNGIETESVVATEELGGCSVGASEAGDVGAVNGRVLQEKELGFSGVDRGVLDLRAGVDGNTAESTSGSRALVKGVLAEAAGVFGGTLRLVG